MRAESHLFSYKASMCLSQGSSSISSGSAASKSLMLAIVEALAEEPASQFSPSSPVRALRRSALSAGTKMHNALARSKCNFVSSSENIESWPGAWIRGRRKQPWARSVLHDSSDELKAQRHRPDHHTRTQRAGLLLGGLCFCDLWFLPSPESMSGLAFAARYSVQKA